MRITSSLMTLEEAFLKYPRKNFLSPKGYNFEYANNILIAFCDKKIVGWFLFTIQNELVYDKKNEKVKKIHQTGTWVSPLMRKQSVAKKINISLIKKLDKIIGRGEYIFHSVVCSIGGAKLWNYRISLTSNPICHEFYDEMNNHNGNCNCYGYYQI